jgi:hypothetical protein
MVKKLLVVLLTLAAACRSAPPSTTPAGAAYGAASPRAAVEAFLAGIRAGDLQAISAVWGDQRGPAVIQSDISRDEVEKRELIMVCYFRHDQARVLEQVSSGEPSHTTYRVELTRGNRTRTPTVSTIQGPQGRWYVVNADIMAVRDFCEPGQQRPPG